MATTDLVTYEEAASFLGNPANAGELNPWVSAVSDRIEDLTGPIVRRDRTEKYNGGGCAILLDEHRNVNDPTGTTAVTETLWTQTRTLTAETNSVKPALGFLIDTRTGTLYRRTSGMDYPFWPGRLNVDVTYTVGICDTTDEVPGRFKQAMKLALKDLWQKHMGTGNSTIGYVQDELSSIPDGWVLPPKVFDLLGIKRKKLVGMA
jgi:hypothetical protein